MEQSSLFNSGFLGAHFNWWVGQIVDDSTWRDNISSNKFEGSSQIPGQRTNRTVYTQIMLYLQTRKR